MAQFHNTPSIFANSALGKTGIGYQTPTTLHRITGKEI